MAVEGSASATTRPLSTTMTRSASAAMSRSWVASTTCCGRAASASHPVTVAQVQQGGRLVRSNDRRLGRQHRGERDELALTTGQVVDALVGDVGQATLGKQPGGDCATLDPIARSGPAG